MWIRTLTVQRPNTNQQWFRRAPFQTLPLSYYCLRTRVLALMLIVITSAKPAVIRSPVARDEIRGRKQPEGLRFAFAGRPKRTACTKRECPGWRYAVFRPFGTHGTHR